jgi:hypothetical protein
MAQLERSSPLTGASAKSATLVEIEPEDGVPNLCCGEDQGPPFWILVYLCNDNKSLSATRITLSSFHTLFSTPLVIDRR